MLVARVSGVGAVRAVLAGALVSALLPAAVWAGASAAGNNLGHACVVVTSPGDPRLQTADPGLDIRAVTLSSDRHLLRIAIAVQDLGGGLPFGRDWTLRFGSIQRNDGYYSADATEQVDGTGYAVYGPGSRQNQPPLATIVGHLDPSHNTVVLDVPLRLLDRHREFDDFLVISGRSIGTSGDLFRNTPLSSTPAGAPESSSVVLDSASGSRVYVAGRGCVHEQ